MINGFCIQTASSLVVTVSECIVAHSKKKKKKSFIYVEIGKKFRTNNALLSKILSYTFTLLTFIGPTSSVPFNFCHESRFRHFIIITLQYQHKNSVRVENKKRFSLNSITIVDSDLFITVRFSVIFTRNSPSDNCLNLIIKNDEIDCFLFQ